MRCEARLRFDVSRQLLPVVREDAAAADLARHLLCLAGRGEKGGEKVARTLRGTAGSRFHLVVEAGGLPETRDPQARHRWPVERTNAWLKAMRRIATRRDRKADNYLAFLHLGMIVILTRSF